MAHGLGRSFEDTTWAQPRLALVAGLTQLDKVSIQGSGWCSLLNIGGAIAMYADHAPIHCSDQATRWRMYGSPSEPSPGQEGMNDILRKWTRLRNADTLLVRKTQDGDLKVGALRQKCQEWLENLSGTGNRTIGEIATDANAANGDKTIIDNQAKQR